jgi:hypothetical protein
LLKQPAEAAALEATAYIVASSAITALQFMPCKQQQDGCKGSAEERPQLAYGCEDGSLALWDARACLELQSFGLHKAAVTCCGFSADGWLLAAGDASGLVSVWDLRRGGLLQLVRWVWQQAAGRWRWALQAALWKLQMPSGCPAAERTKAASRGSRLEAARAQQVASIPPICTPVVMTASW